MKARGLQVALLAALLFAMPPLYSASPAIDTLLQQAYTVRSANRTRFNELLDALNQRVDEASPEQKQRLDYLNAYRMVYVGDTAGASAVLKRLFDETKDPALRFQAAALLANAYAGSRQFSEGLSYVDQLLSLVEGVTDMEVRHQGLLTAAILYNQVGQYELGRYYSDQILGEDHASDRSRCFAGNLRLEALLNLGRLPPDDAPFDALVEQCLAQGEVIAANFVRLYLARRWFGEGKHDEAIALLERNVDAVEATEYPRLISDVRSLLAELYLARDDYAKADSNAQRAISYRGVIAISPPVVAAYRTLYNSALARGDTDGALDNHRRYAEADKAYLNDVKTRELAYQLARHQTLQKNQTIEILNKQNEVLRLQQQVASQAAQNNRLLAALLAVLLTSIGFWAFKLKRVQISFRRLAETDALTGVSNRHHFTRHADEALKYAAHNGQHVCLIMFDLDHFKDVNDRYGHPTGDWVLKQAAEACRQLCRKNDHIGRLGGEEFAVLLIGCDPPAAVHMAEQARERIAALDTRECGHVFTVTASFGVTSTLTSGFEFKSLVAHADQALYQSKHGGRNQVSLYRSPPRPGTEEMAHEPAYEPGRM